MTYPLWFLLGNLYHLPRHAHLLCTPDVKVTAASAGVTEDVAKADTQHKRCARCLTIAALWPKAPTL